jgi:hypothetical protein
MQRSSAVEAAMARLSKTGALVFVTVFTRALYRIQFQHGFVKNSLVACAVVRVGSYALSWM